MVEKNVAVGPDPRFDCSVLGPAEDDTNLSGDILDEGKETDIQSADVSKAR